MLETDLCWVPRSLTTTQEAQNLFFGSLNFSSILSLQMEGTTLQVYQEAG